MSIPSHGKRGSRPHRKGLTKRAIQAVALGTSAVVLASCAAGTGASDDGSSIEEGAARAEYVEAFAEVSPETIFVQATNAQGSLNVRNLERYLETVTDWSDGKLQFDIAYANAVAPAAEVDRALNDGRLDFGLVLPSYNPEGYPVSSELAKATLFSRQTPVEGTLAATAAIKETSMNTPEFLAEFEDKGMKVLDPAHFTGGPLVTCSEPRTSLSDFDGITAASGSRYHSEQLEALGASPVSLPYTELYEAVQRGVADCVVNAVTGSIAAGTLPLTPHVTQDPAVPGVANPAVWAFSKSKWESLPLIARQLLWDKLPVLYGEHLQSSMELFAQASQQISDADGAVIPYSSDARARLQEKNDEVLGSIGSSEALDDPNALAARAKEMAAKWDSVPETMGFEDEADLASFDTWLNTAKPDFSPFADEVHKQIFSPSRP